jgi:hypothetical protein
MHGDPVGLLQRRCLLVGGASSARTSASGSTHEQRRGGSRGSCHMRRRWRGRSRWTPLPGEISSAVYLHQFTTGEISSAGYLHQFTTGLEHSQEKTASSARVTRSKDSTQWTTLPTPTLLTAPAAEALAARPRRPFHKRHPLCAVLLRPHRGGRSIADSFPHPTHTLSHRRAAAAADDTSQAARGWRSPSCWAHRRRA